MKKKYFFQSTCFDKELFRRQLIILNENSIDYQVVNKSNKTSVRAPLSSYFEAELLVTENDFEKAEQLLSQLIE